MNLFGGNLPAAEVSRESGVVRILAESQHSRERERERERESGA